MAIFYLFYGFLSVNSSHRQFAFLFPAYPIPQIFHTFHRCADNLPHFPVPLFARYVSALPLPFGKKKFVSVKDGR